MRALSLSVLVVASLVAAEPAREPLSPEAIRTAPHVAPRSIATRPLVFEANAGQTDSCVRFLARGGGGTAFLTDDAAVVALPRGPLAIRPVGARTPPDVASECELPGKANYLIGRDPSKWRTNVPTFARVRYREVWPGIDLVFHGDGAALEYDFVVAPGADAARIEVAFDGADRIDADDGGGLTISARGATMRQRGPLVWQEDGGARRAVGGRCEIDGDRVRFIVGEHDPALPLVIDPALYTTYLGGNDPSGGLERVQSMTTDAAGAIYLAGGTTSPDFPRASAYQTTYGGGGQFVRGDEFASKLDPTGTTLVYSTYLGGSQDDEANGIGVDTLGNAYVGGEVYSTDFPTTPGAFLTTYESSGDGVVSKLGPAGDALVWSTYIGGRASGVYGLTVDGAGHAYCVGGSYENFATTIGAAQPVNNGSEDIVVFEMALDGASMVYATYLGGGSPDRGSDIVVTPSGEACVSGYTFSGDFPASPPTAFQTTYGGGLTDGVVARVNSGGTAFVFSTYVGGSGEDEAVGNALDADGNLLIVGYTTSTDLPTVAPLQPANHGGQEAFVAKFTATGDVPYCTYLGGSGNEIAYAAATNADGSLWLTGYTTSSDFPTVDAEKSALGGGNDAFLAHLDAAGDALDHSTYVGGTGDDYGYALALDPSGAPLLSGQTSSADLVTTPGAAQSAFGGGSDDAWVSTKPAPPAITSFFLPKKVVAKANAAAPAKSTLSASGIFDTGPDEPNFASAATLDVGKLHFDIAGLVKRGKVFAYADGGVSFSIAPNPYGSSRAKFKLKYTGDFAGQVALDGPLDLYFSNAVTDGGGTVELGHGVFGLGKVRGSLVQPNLFVVRAHAVFKGAGKDALTVIVGLATAGTTPDTASDLAIGFGSQVSQVIPGTSFQRRGDTDVFTGPAPGITKAVVDYAREQIAVTAKGLDLSAFEQGGNTVQITVGLGGDQRAVIVRMGRIGNLMKY
jgi:hypothetical protein